MLDSIKRMSSIERDGPDLMSDIEGLHPLLGELKPHVQCRVTWSETKLVICDEVVGEKGFHINCSDEFHDLADDWT